MKLKKIMETITAWIIAICWAISTILLTAILVTPNQDIIKMIMAASLIITLTPIAYFSGMWLINKE